MDIRGPDRRHRQDAPKDLEDMRAAGAVGSTREKGLEIMAAEARRIQLSAYLAAEARAAQQRQREEELAAEEDAMSEEEPDDEPWLMDYPSPREDVASTPLEKLPLTPEGPANAFTPLYFPAFDPPAFLRAAACFFLAATVFLRGAIITSCIEF